MDQRSGTASRSEATDTQEVDLRPGPHWSSFEQVRLNEVDGLLNGLQEDHVGTPDFKNREFVRLQASSFQCLLGIELGDLFAPVASPLPARSRVLVFDADEQVNAPVEELDFELDPAKIPRPQWMLG